MKKALILTIFSPVISFSWVIPLIPNGPFLKTSKNSFVDLNFAMQSWMQLDGKVVNNDQNSTNFAVRDARIIMNGQINKYIQFGSLFDFADNNLLGFDGSARRHQATTTISDIQDAFINFTYNNKVNFTMGLFRDPLDRVTLTGIYATVIPTLYGYGIGPIDKFSQVPFINPMFPLSFGSIPANPAGVQDPFRDVGAALWGNINKGMFKYYFQVGNGKYDYQSSSSSEDPFKIDKSNLKYTFRLTFTPTFLGYKADQDYMVKDTYLGSMNTLTIGIGYSFQKRECSGSPNSNCINPQNSVLPAQSVTSKAFAADIFGSKSLVILCQTSK